MKTRKECAETCCPFAFTEESEIIQNYGCLPAPIDILDMYKNGKSWACHSNPTKPCAGAIKALKERNLYKGAKPLLTERDDWGDFLSPETES